MFIKYATIGDIVTYNNDVQKLSKEWKNIVYSGQNFCSSDNACPFLEQFDWSPDEFLYYRARAITANKENANGDFFPYEELEKSFHTFVGKGIYYNHDSDKPQKAFGIILDAVLHVYPDDQYVQILGAIDKNDIESKRPGLLTRIQRGDLKTTSMSVAVQRCQCSVCGNIADRPEHLCLVPGSLITLYNGTQKPIEEIKIGDKVVTHNGNIRTVTRIFSREINETIREIYTLGNTSLPIRVTKNHPLFLLKWEDYSCRYTEHAHKCEEGAGERCRAKWCSRPIGAFGFHDAGVAKIGDLVSYPHLSSEALRSTLSTDEAEFLGYYCAEGSGIYHYNNERRQPAGVSFSISTKEEQTLGRRINELSVKLFGKNAHFYAANSGSGIRVHIHGADVYKFCTTHCSEGVKTKVLSDDVVHGMPEVRTAFLAAFIEASGTVNRNVLACSTASKALAQQIRFIGYSLGIPTSQWVQQTNKSPLMPGGTSLYQIRFNWPTAPVYQEIVTGLTKYKPEYLNRKIKAQIFQFSDRIGVPIVGIKEVPYSGVVYNLEVDGDNSYIANNLAVHNCDHMRPSTKERHNPYYVKGKYYKNKKAYEINYGLQFLEDSLVEVPADSTAEVFQIYACKQCPDPEPINPISAKLTDHFQRYSSLRKSAEPAPVPPVVDDRDDKKKPSFSLDEMIESTIERKLEKKVEQIIDENVRKRIDPMLKAIEDSTAKIVSDKVEQKIDTKSKELGTITDKLLPSVSEKADEGSDSEKYTEKMLEKPSEKEETKPTVKKTSVAEEQSAELLNKILQKKEEKKLKKDKEEAKHVEYPQSRVDRLTIDETSSLVKENNKYVLYKGDKRSSQPEVSFDIEPGWESMDSAELNKILKQKYEEWVASLVKPELPEVTPKTAIPTSIEKKELSASTSQTSTKNVRGGKIMKITYAKGPDLNQSYFVAEDGEKVTKISAAEITPKSIQRRIQANDPNVQLPDQIVEQLNTLSEGNYDKLVNEVFPELKKAAMESDVSEQEISTEKQDVESPKAEEAVLPESAATQTAMKKEAEYSWAESEVEVGKQVKPAEGPIMAVDEKEAAGGKETLNGSTPSKVKQYYGRLPGKGVGEPEAAINVQSSVMENRVVAEKIKLLKQALEEEKGKREAVETELKIEKDKAEKRDKLGLIEQILDSIADVFDIEDEEKGKVTELLNKFAPGQLQIFQQIIGIISKKAKGDSIEGLAGKTMGVDKPKAPVAPKAPSKAPFPLPGSSKPVEKPIMKTEASLPQLFMDINEKEHDLIELAQKSLE